MLIGNIHFIDIQIPAKVAQYIKQDPGVRYRVGGARRRRGRSCGVGDDDFDAVLWLAVGVSSGIEIAQAVLVGHWAGFFQRLVAAILFGVVGVIIITRPLISAEVLTVFIATFFLIGGLFSSSRRWRSRRPAGAGM